MTVDLSNYVDLEIPPATEDQAENMFEYFEFDRKELNKFGSEGERTVEGYIGQIMVADYLGVSATIDSYEYDLVFCKKKLEVKTISGKVMPKPIYLATVNSPYLDKPRKQEADYYIFTRILNSHKRGWIVGFCRCDIFWKISRYVKKGEEVYPGQVFKMADGYVVEIKNLYPFLKLVEHLREV
jgi:hypothetical protein